MMFPALAALFTLLPEDEQPTAQGGLLDMLPLMLVIFAIFYFVLIAPERKKQKKRQAMLDDLKKGDKVMTASGIFATVGQIKEGEVTMIVADGVRIRFSRAAIQDILTDEKKDTEKKDAEKKDTETNK